jgi:hypothetical protein
MAKIITIDGKEWDIKYKQNEESITNEFGSVAYRYPDFVGSKLYHNSTSSDKYSLSFTVHQNNILNFKESFKKVVDPNNLVNHSTYGKLEHIVLEHDLWGAVVGNVIGAVVYHTSKQGDIKVKCTFQEHTDETLTQKKDLETENEQAFTDLDFDSSDYDVEISTIEKSRFQNFYDNLNQLYINIKNSAVTSAFNDLNSELTKATLNSMRVMNAFKNIIALPNVIYTDTRSRLALLHQQSTAIMNIPATTANLVLFNTKIIAYNTGLSSRAIFVSDAAQEAAAGIKTVPMS